MITRPVKAIPTAIGTTSFISLWQLCSVCEKKKVWETKIRSMGKIKVKMLKKKRKRNKEKKMENIPEENCPFLAFSMKAWIRRPVNATWKWSLWVLGTVTWPQEYECVFSTLKLGVVPFKVTLNLVPKTIEKLIENKKKAGIKISYR